MANEQVVVGASSVKRFAVAIQKRLVKQAATGPFESQTIDAVTDQAIQELNDAVQCVAEADQDNGVLFVPNNQTAALLMSFLAEKQPLPEAKASTQVLEAELGHEDIGGWVSQFLPAWLKGRFSKHDFVKPGAVVRVPNDFRLAVLGDWGSGLYGAPISAASIQTTKPAFNSVLHLGDVYYAGTKKEVTERFLNLWPDVPGASSWALNSNHEMFSGGSGYFETTLADARFTGQDGSSCFAWENDHFLFLGLDTAYEEHAIGAEQSRWIHERAQAASGKRLILFSHHQPFSAFETDGARLVAALGELLSSGRVAAWYWGHEHRCVFFEKHVKWSMWGRCIGHGGYPEVRDKFAEPPESTNADGSSWMHVESGRAPGAWVLDGPNQYVKENPARYGPNGYVALHFEGSVIHETVHAPDGALLMAHDIP